MKLPPLLILSRHGSDIVVVMACECLAFAYVALFYYNRVMWGAVFGDTPFKLCIFHPWVTNRYGSLCAGGVIQSSLQGGVGVS